MEQNQSQLNQPEQANQSQTQPAQQVIPLSTQESKRYFLWIIFAGVLFFLVGLILIFVAKKTFYNKAEIEANKNINDTQIFEKNNPRKQSNETLNKDIASPTNQQKIIIRDPELNLEEKAAAEAVVNAQINNPSAALIECNEGSSSTYAQDSYGKCQSGPVVIYYESGDNKCSFHLTAERSIVNGNIECKINKVDRTIKAVNASVSCFIDYNNGIIKYHSPESTCEINTKTGEKNFSVSNQK